MAILLLGASGITVLDELALSALFNTEDWSVKEARSTVQVWLVKVAENSFQ